MEHGNRLPFNAWINSIQVSGRAKQLLIIAPVFGDMKIYHMKKFYFSFVAVAGMATATIAQEKPQPTFMEAQKAYALMDDVKAKEAKAYALGFVAVQWGTQWVKAGEAFHMQTAPLPDPSKRSPYDPQPHGMNVWGHAQKLLNSQMRLIETPNTETLYSICLLDLKDGPVVVVHPDFKGRYFRTSVWDLHSETHTISQKQDGDHPAPYAIIPYGWKGKLPAGLKSITLRSRYVTLAPHIAVNDEKDLDNVHALQKGLKLIALKDWGKTNRELAPGDPMRPARRPGTATPPELYFFEELCEFLKDMTIRDDEMGFARQLRDIGITLKDGFQYGNLDAATVAGLKRAFVDAEATMAHDSRKMGPVQPGGAWSIMGDVTSIDNWANRAAVGFGYVWGDLGSEVVYANLRVDEKGASLDGTKKYILTFPKGQLPPARYWRISLYDLNGFFTDNVANRWGIGNMAEKLQPNPDGSLTLYIQHNSPGKDKEANWLPCPAEGFFLIMRIYQPEEKMYKGQYILPAVKKVE